VDVRVIAATNRSPEQAVAAGKLREDLLYRLQVIPLQLPPLRARAGDVRILARHFLAQLNQANRTTKVFSELALMEFEGHDYPGNVRELYNLVQRAYVMTDGRVIASAGIDKNAWATPGERTSQVGFQVGDTLASVERRVIEKTLERCKTKDEAARILGVSTKTLYNKLRRYQTERLNGIIKGASQHRNGAGMN
jgi:DNA-binding NtrC family response regulator